MIYFKLLISYDICIRQEDGFCCVKYSLCDADSWEIDQNDGTKDKSYTSKCTNDYIEIAGLHIRVKILVQKICTGQTFFANPPECHILASYQMWFAKDC